MGGRRLRRAYRSHAGRARPGSWQVLPPGLLQAAGVCLCGISWLRGLFGAGGCRRCTYRRYPCRRYVRCRYRERECQQRSTPHVACPRERCLRRGAVPKHCARKHTAPLGRRHLTHGPQGLSRCLWRGHVPALRARLHHPLRRPRLEQLLIEWSGARLDVRLGIRGSVDQSWVPAARLGDGRKFGIMPLLCQLTHTGGTKGAWLKGLCPFCASCRDSASQKGHSPKATYATLGCCTAAICGILFKLCADICMLSAYSWRIRLVVYGARLESVLV